MTQEALDLLLEGNAHQRHAKWQEGIAHYPDPIPGLAIVAQYDSALPQQRKACTIKRKQRLTLSKLAKASPAIVRSVQEQAKHERIIARAMPVLEARYAQLRSQENKRRRHNITLAMRKLCCPMFGVRIGDFSCYVTANVLSDYGREGISFEVTSMPIFQRHGRLASIKTKDIDMEYIDSFAEARANNHAMGMAQTAYRIARIEGDSDAQWVAHSWLFHGFLAKQCKNPNCHKHRDPTTGEHTSPCKEVAAMRTTANKLMVLALQYLSPDDRSRFHGSRTPNKLRPPLKDEADGARPYYAETYDEMRVRLRMR